MNECILNTNNEHRTVTIKDFKTFNINNYKKKTSFNVIFITSDNKILLAERKFSFYMDILFNISRYKQIYHNTLKEFINTFYKLNLYEKFMIINKKRISNKYISIINFIEKYFDDNIIKYCIEKNDDIDYILSNTKLGLYAIEKYKYKLDINIISNKLRVYVPSPRDYKTFVLPGGKKEGNECIDALIKREANEEINIPNTCDMEILNSYYSETIIFDKKLFKRFIDVTFISKLKYASYEIKKYFRSNREINNIKFIPVDLILEIMGKYLLPNNDSEFHINEESLHTILLYCIHMFLIM
jgi:8-oxo-dGTP pyrophosphatase MutT (NUDIX family)